MYVSSPVDVAGLRILIVEDEELLAADMSVWVQTRGGVALGTVATPEAALAALDDWIDLDALLVDVETANGLKDEIVGKVRGRDIAIMWIVGDDGWFFDPNEEACVYRLEGDPENVIRVSWSEN